MINRCNNLDIIEVSLNLLQTRRTIISVNNDLYFIDYYLSLYNIRSNILFIKDYNGKRFKYFLKNVKHLDRINYIYDDNISSICKVLGIVKYDYRKYRNRIILNIIKTGIRKPLIDYNSDLIYDRIVKIIGNENYQSVADFFINSISKDIEKKNLSFEDTIFRHLPIFISSVNDGLYLNY